MKPKEMPKELYETIDFKGVISEDYDDLINNLTDEYGETAVNDFDNFYDTYELVSKTSKNAGVYKNSNDNELTVQRKDDGSFKVTERIS